MEKFGADALSLDRLKATLSGKVVVSDSPEFQDIRSSIIWNRRLPDASTSAAIVHVASEADVAATLRFANKQKLKVGLRSGGHNYHGSFLRNNDLVLDMGALNTITVDSAARRASVGPGVRSAELMSRLATHGLSFPAGHCPDTGVSGFLLGGGWGWNAGEWGPACMSITGVQMVTAAGDLLFANENSNADLLWAARGSGRGFFAAVTRYDIAVFDNPRSARALSWTFSLEHAAEVAEWFERAIETAHPTTEVICNLLASSPGNPGAITVMAFAVGDTPKTTSAKFGELKQPPPRVQVLAKTDEQETDFTTLMSQVANVFFPPGKRMIGDQRYSNSRVNDLIFAALPLLRSGPGGLSYMMISSFGQRKWPAPNSDAALSMQGELNVSVFSFWDDPAHDMASRNWARSVMGAVQPYSVGSYISEADLDSDPGLSRRCFSPDAWNRLTELKHKYDPSNIFPWLDSIVGDER